MSNLIEFSGQYFSNGEQVPFQVVIGMPEELGPPEDYLCRVVSQQLFSRCMNVYGVSRYQAVHLAVGLVKEALTSRVVTEEDESDDLGGATGGEEEKKSRPEP